MKYCVATVYMLDQLYKLKTTMYTAAVHADGWVLILMSVPDYMASHLRG